MNAVQAPVPLSAKAFARVCARSEWRCCPPPVPPYLGVANGCSCRHQILNELPTKKTPFARRADGGKRHARSSSNWPPAEAATSGRLRSFRQGFQNVFAKSDRGADEATHRRKRRRNAGGLFCPKCLWSVGHVQWLKCSECDPQTCAVALQVLEAGRASRATACTDLNERSSRSHALLMVSVAGLNGTTGSRTQGDAGAAWRGGRLTRRPLDAFDPPPLPRQVS